MANKVNLTEAQKAAVAADGNILVVAGAGTGKTHTLVERCVRILLESTPPVSISDILMVTFTEAAAREMKERIRGRLGEVAGTARGEIKRRLEEELALLGSAHIQTLHSFCRTLAAEHFQELGIDPSVNVLSDAQALVLVEETLDALFEEFWKTGSGLAEAGQSLVGVYGEGDEEPVRQLVWQLHHFAQTLPNPDQWYAAQLAVYDAGLSPDWTILLQEAFELWRSRSLADLNDPDHPSSHVAAYQQALERLPKSPGLSDIAAVLAPICSEGATLSKSAWEKQKHFYGGAAFLQSLSVDGGRKAWNEDWDRMRPHMRSLLMLAQRFSESFWRAKVEGGVVDFHDLEQMALRLLTREGRPTNIAEECRKKFAYIFVDEYQDINQAQDAILQAVSREEAGNRFLVGDIKQSIYCFRLADPSIFRAYQKLWETPPGRTFNLTENFRSQESLLHFINQFFRDTMRSGLGGVNYDEQAQLAFARQGPRSHGPAVEVHIRLQDAEQEETHETEAETTIVEVVGAEEEARLIANRLQALFRAGHRIWDDAKQAYRPVEYGDMVILLRAPGEKASAYYKQFQVAGIPLQVERGGLFENVEIRDLLSILRVLDNPLQDVPLLAALRSPLCGLTLNELAEIRLAAPREYYWTALVRWRQQNETNPNSAGTFAKVQTFLERFSKWRRLARETSLSDRLEIILEETHYFEWLLGQERREQKRANVQRLLQLARQFDPVQRHGLQRFLRFIKLQQEAEADREPAALEDLNAVQLMSIHRSKGLEFPVVVVADLAKAFNDRDLKAPILLDRELGVCPVIRPEGKPASYPSLPYWVSKERKRAELVNEELRLLYVAMTRARDLLLLVGSAKEKKVREAWPAEADCNAEDLLQARSFLHWLGPWIASQALFPLQSGDSGETNLFRWHLHRKTAAATAPEPVPAREAAPSPGAMSLQQLIKKLEWEYSWPRSTTEPAKLRISTLKQRARDEETPAESSDLFPPPQRPRIERQKKKGRARVDSLTGPEIGIAHHTLLELLDVERVSTIEELQSQVSHLVAEELLSPVEASVLNLQQIHSFWQSEIGRRLISCREYIHRELPFTVRITPGDLAAMRIYKEDGLRENDLFLVQGFIDLAVIQPKEIWIVDFKSDLVGETDLAAKTQYYTPQLKVYAYALEQIYRRPVTERHLHFLSLNRTIGI